MVMNHYHHQTFPTDPEVVRESNLEVASHQVGSADQQNERYISLSQQHTTYEVNPIFTPDLKDAPRSKNGNARLRLFGSTILIAIVSMVIGGVGGWQVTEYLLNRTSSDKSGGEGSTGSDSDSGTSTGRQCTANDTLISTSLVRSGTALAATGWRYGTEHTIWLYFQGRDDSLQSVIYDSLYGSWAGPTTLSLDERAVAGTSLTATTLLWNRNPGEPPQPQAQLVYQDISGTLKGLVWYVFFNQFGLSLSCDVIMLKVSKSSSPFSEVKQLLLTLWCRRSGYPSVGWRAGIGNQGFAATSGSGLASFAPGFYLQGSNGSVSETIFNGTYTALATLPISPASGTPLLAIPRTKSHSGNELRLFFRRDMDGQIAVFERYPNFTAVYDTDGEPVLPFGTANERSNLAGFTVAGYADTDELNTMILMQDVSSGNITYTWIGDASGWQDSTTDDVFHGAGVGGMSCVTAATTWAGYGVKPLEVSNDMNKCYFLVNGRIKEVWWDGSSWTDNGFI